MFSRSEVLRLPKSFESLVKDEKLLETLKLLGEMSLLHIRMLCSYPRNNLNPEKIILNRKLKLALSRKRIYCYRNMLVKAEFCKLSPKTLNLDQLPFKDISYLELRRPFKLAQPNHLCNFGRRHYEQHFCVKLY